MELVIQSLEEHVKRNPDDAKVAISYDHTGAVSMERMLREMKAETEWGKEQYKKLIGLTLHLLRRKKIAMPQSELGAQ